ncbi:ABC transporter substrate-binding protein [Yoonia litorea]|uniref:NitT/TauT family transport system ATP-binding protein n=1 Tax=Yoonia litorea TaxID=1123755 RepID=A0A1I6LQN3_9RHOB|nr:ABC transporter substrate-binding protein [Yoonia litorea]SFS05784.1 NitT/TauT family transport system ATP-binding protein [Yoonia litorea]
MKPVEISVAYMPLVDAAPLIIAQEMGFAQSEGIALNLIAAPSWSSVRDMLAFGRVDAAHLLSPVPIASAMRMGGVSTQISAVSVLSVNGNVIGVSRALEAKLRDAGYPFDFADPVAASAALAAVSDGPLTFGVPFPFSMHVALLRYWAEGTSLGRDGIRIRTVPPPLMANALAAGDVDAFCVGEPWGSVAMETGAGALILPGRAIWNFAPEKVLSVRTDWAETEPDLLGRLMRAVWRAGRWLSHPDVKATASDLLSRKAYLDVSAELIDRALSGHLSITHRGDHRAVPGFLEFYAGAATFPWRSQAKWIMERLVQEHGAEPLSDAQIARVFRTDLHRRHLASVGCDLPGASSKVEGAILAPTAVASAAGEITLHPDRFFDGKVFDPDRL